MSIHNGHKLITLKTLTTFTMIVFFVSCRMTSVLSLIPTYYSKHIKLNPAALNTLLNTLPLIYC